MHHSHLFPEENFSLPDNPSPLFLGLLTQCVPLWTKVSTVSRFFRLKLKEGGVSETTFFFGVRIYIYNMHVYTNIKRRIDIHVSICTCMSYTHFYARVWVNR